METRIVRGPILRPRHSGVVEFLPDGALEVRSDGTIGFIGPYEKFRVQSGITSLPVKTSLGIITPPFLDAHLHIPQHPIRGRFLQGVPTDVKGGRLLAGLAHNVFPAERRVKDERCAEEIVRQFEADTLSQGVVGGSAYMSVHTTATAAALSLLPDAWSVGLVLMNRNCPPDLRTDENRLDEDIARLAEKYGRRLIVTDRFAVCVDSSLRQHGARLAGQYGLRMQTHLNEQRAEKAQVEQELYPGTSYTEVYRRDGLLDHDAILAHCIHMSSEEFKIVRDAGASIAHCPVSNTLLGSGIMPLDAVIRNGIEYALCTDVGASSTTSLLCEMAQFLRVHAGRSPAATACEALFRVTLAPARILHLEDDVGLLDEGEPASFLEINHSIEALEGLSAAEVIREGLLDGVVFANAPSWAEHGKSSDLDRLETGDLEEEDALARLTSEVEAIAHKLQHKVARVTLWGAAAWEQDGTQPG